MTRQMPEYSNPQCDEKSHGDASDDHRTPDAFTLLTMPNQRGHLAPYQRFPLILHRTSTSFGFR